MVSARVVHVTLSVRIPQVVGAHLHVVGAHLRMIGLHLRGVGAHQCVVASMYEKWLEIGLVKVYKQPVADCGRRYRFCHV